MALIDEYYNIDYDPEYDAFKKGMGTFLATRIRENKEKFARQLQAADPSMEAELLKEDMRILRELEKQFSDLRAKTTGGGSFTRTESGPDMLGILKLKEDKLAKQQAESDKFLRGYSSSQGFKSTMKDRIIDRHKGKDFDNPDSIRSMRSSVKSIMQDHQDKESGNRTRSGRHGFGIHLMQEATNAGLPAKQIKTIEAVLRDQGALPSQSDYDMYEDPTILTEEEEAELEAAAVGKKSDRTTTPRMAPGIDPQVIGASLLARIKEQRARVQRGRQRYDQAVAEYRGLASGPDYNIAIAPISTRPTRLTQTLGMYSDLRESDPSYARDVLEASREEGALVTPDRYVGMGAGRAPIDSLLDTTDVLATLRGKKFDPPGPGEFGSKTPYTPPRDFGVEDIQAVKDAFKQMKRSVESPLYSGQKYGKIDSQGESMELSEYLSNGLQLIEELEKEDPDIAVQAAQDLSDELIDWKESQTEETIKDDRRRGNPGAAVAKSLGGVRTALRDYEDDGNEEKLSKSIRKTAKDFADTDRQNIGEYGAEFLQLVDQFENTGNINIFSNAVSDMQVSADEYAINAMRDI